MASFLFIINLFIHASVSQNCEEQGLIKHINWDTLITEGGAEIPNHSCTIHFNTTTFVLDVDCDLEYLGYATDNYLSQGNESLGITYWIGMSSFYGTRYLSMLSNISLSSYMHCNSRNTIDEAGTCSNRKSSSFDAVSDFNDWWTYSLNPSEPNQIGQPDAFLAYPEPTEFWNLSIDADTCTPINYHGIFTWTDLLNCEDASGRKLIEADDDGTEITFSGTVYVNLVSPHVMHTTDSTFYRVYPLVQQDWAISILKQTNVLSSTEIKLFVLTVVSTTVTADAILIVIFTLSSDFMSLGEGEMADGGGTITMLSPEGECIGSSGFTCGQMFQIRIELDIPSFGRRRLEETNCTVIYTQEKYEVIFTFDCEVGTVACDAFIEQNGGTNQIILDIYVNFVDASCDPMLYEAIFTGSSTFYDDGQYSVVHDDSVPYRIGVDYIYVETEVDFPGDSYNVFNIDLLNVFVCTVPVADEGSIETDLDQQSGSGGCLSNYTDTDGFFMIVQNGVGNGAYKAQIHYDEQSNVVRFSFLTFNTGREKIFIHIQTMLELNTVETTTTDAPNQRRLLAETENSNQIRHFLTGTTVVAPSEEPLLFDDEGVSERDAESSYGARENFYYIYLYIHILTLYIFIL